MERLTIRTSKGAALKMEDHYPSDEAARAALMEKYCVAMNRLADYEDAIDMYADERRRLFPDEVDKIKEKVVSASFGLKTSSASRRELDVVSLQTTLDAHRTSSWNCCRPKWHMD